MDGLEEMHAYSTDERLYEYFEYDPFITIDDTKQYLQKLIDLEGNDDLMVEPPFAGLYEGLKMIK